ncbi:cadmium resistance transporter [Halopenitus sp. H-Gu1]|uniref:cadmium resistance transporter n=1 Tax=Halopenitus sp. H-Gu1 TaxID=3242697 RepID=UPI00359DEAF9
MTTNLDDILVLTVFFTRVDGSLRSWHVVSGQYVGFAVLLFVSVLGYLGAVRIPKELVGLLGLIPLAIGLRGAVAAWRGQSDGDDVIPGIDHRTEASGWQNVSVVASVTVANGGDNIAIYVPLFATRSAGQVSGILLVFGVLIAIWCGIGYLLADHPQTVRVIDRVGHVGIPLMFIGLGGYILIEAETLSWIGTLIW